jgi:hypothetical protein
MLHVFKGEILANMTQVSDVAPGPLVFSCYDHLIFGTLLCNNKIQIKCEFGFDPWIFHEVTALGLDKKNHELLVFWTFFSLCLQIFI